MWQVTRNSLQAIETIQNACASNMFVDYCHRYGQIRDSAIHGRLPRDILGLLDRSSGLLEKITRKHHRHGDSDAIRLSVFPNYLRKMVSFSFFVLADRVKCQRAILQSSSFLLTKVKSPVSTGYIVICLSSRTSNILRNNGVIINRDNRILQISKFIDTCLPSVQH